MRIQLKDWDLAKRRWSLEIETGRISIARKGACHGYVHILADGNKLPAILPGVAAVYSKNRQLWFQIDAERWPMIRLEFRHTNLAEGWSRINIGGDADVEIIYPGPLADPVNRHDPTFDEQDLEDFDFFYYVTRQYERASWGAAIGLWEEGFEGLCGNLLEELQAGRQCADPGSYTGGMPGCVSI